MAYRVVQLPLAPSMDFIAHMLNDQDRAGWDYIGCIDRVMIFRENERKKRIRMRILTGDRG